MCGFVLTLVGLSVNLALTATLALLVGGAAVLREGQRLSYPIEILLVPFDARSRPGRRVALLTFAVLLAPLGAMGWLGFALVCV